MRALLLAAAIAALSSTNAWAWGGLGHRIVCEIAYRLAATETRAEMRRLIRQDPEFDRFSDSCTWPDNPRQRPSEHFLNLPRTVLGLETDDCAPAPKCVLSAIESDVAVLSNSTASDEDKLAALKFIGHWVGDIHQPLHVSFKDDKGGNDIESQGNCAGNMHGAWDTCLVIEAVGEDVGDAATSVLEEVTLVMQEEWLISEPLDWANESFAISIDPETGYCTMAGSSCDIPAAQPVTIDSAYVEMATPIVREQLAKAGIRLARLLDDAL